MRNKSMLNAMLLASVLVGPEQFVGERAPTPWTATVTPVRAAASGTEVAVVVENQLNTSLWRVASERTPAGILQAMLPERARPLAIAGNGSGDHAVVWTRSDGLRITLLTADGDVVTRDLLPESPRWMPAAAVASDGRNYFVVWLDSSRLYGRMVNEGGDLLSAVIRLDSRYVHDSELDVASNGTGFLVLVRQFRSFCKQNCTLTIPVGGDGQPQPATTLPDALGDAVAIDVLGGAYVVMTASGDAGRAVLFDRSGRLAGEPIPLPAAPSKTAQHNASIFFVTADRRVFRFDHDLRTSQVPAELPPYIVDKTLVSNGVSVLWIGGHASIPVQVWDLATGFREGRILGEAVLDQSTPRVARAGAINGVTWDEGPYPYFARVSERGSPDGRGIRIPSRPAVASDGVRRLMLFLGATGYPIPLEGPIEASFVPSGWWSASDPAPIWTGKNFVALSSVPNLMSKCIGTSFDLVATATDADGRVQQERTPIRVPEQTITPGDPLGTGDGFVVFYSEISWWYRGTTCGPEYAPRASAYDPELRPRGGFHPPASNGLAGDNAGTFLLGDGRTAFAIGRMTGRAEVGFLRHAAWDGRAFIFARQNGDAIELASWDPRARPIVPDWGSLEPVVAIRGAGVRLEELAGSESGAVLVYTRAIDGWRRVVLREIRSSPARRRSTAAFGGAATSSR